MKPFHVADLSRTGDLVALETYGYAELEQVPGASELIVHFATNLYRSPEEFQVDLPRELPSHRQWTYRWRASAPTAGIATLRHQAQLASLGLLASGLNSEADQITLGTFQQHLVQELRDTGFEPAFDLMQIAKRPLVVSIPFLEPAEAAEQMIVALADRCFAAAYFRYMNLA
jgi:hypothetical protein